ncbi:MAG: beta strand repeat-containing protein [Ignavibacteriaceae bacterium]
MTHKTIFKKATFFLFVIALISFFAMGNYAKAALINPNNGPLRINDVAIARGSSATIQLLAPSGVTSYGEPYLDLFDTQNGCSINAVYSNQNGCYAWMAPWPTPPTGMSISNYAWNNYPESFTLNVPASTIKGTYTMGVSYNAGPFTNGLPPTVNQSGNGVLPFTITVIDPPTPPAGSFQFTTSQCVPSDGASKQGTVQFSYQGSSISVPVTLTCPAQTATLTLTPAVTSVTVAPGQTQTVGLSATGNNVTNISIDQYAAIKGINQSMITSAKVVNGVLNLTAATNAVPGSTGITVTPTARAKSTVGGTDPTATTDISVTIAQPPTPCSFNLNASPTTLTVPQGTSQIVTSLVSATNITGIDTGNNPIAFSFSPSYASNYSIYPYVTSVSSASPTTQSKNLNFSVTRNASPNTYPFTVTATGTCGSGSTITKTATVSVVIAPPAPILTITATPQSSSAIQISGLSTTGATSYKVYRNNWNASNTFPKGNSYPLWFTTTSSTPGPSFTDSSLPASSQFYYFAEAYDASGVKIATSAVVSATTLATQTSSFSLTPVPATITVPQGVTTSASSIISATALNGVTASSISFPSASSPASASNYSIMTNLSSIGAPVPVRRLTFSILGTAVPGTYPFVVTAIGIASDGSAISQTATVNVVVTPSTPTSFALSLTPTQNTISTLPGTAAYTVTVNRSGGYNGAVNVSSNLSGQGVSGSFGTSAVISASQTSIAYTASASSNAANGSYPFTVTGTGGGNTVTSNQATVVVNQTPIPNPLACSLSASPVSDLGSVTPTLTIAASGGTAPYSYTIDGQSLGSVTTLTKTYSATQTISGSVSDSGGQTATCSTSVSVTPISFSLSLSSSTMAVSIVNGVQYTITDQIVPNANNNFPGNLPTASVTYVPSLTLISATSNTHPTIVAPKINGTTITTIISPSTLTQGTTYIYSLSVTATGYYKSKQYNLGSTSGTLTINAKSLGGGEGNP